MGGIATSDVAKIRDDVNGLMVLSPEAILQFAREGVFFDITHETISDRSKANLLGKGLVCMQVIWFLIQCVARAAARYPLVLIEVHTMVHVVCALVMYVLWWKVSLEMPLEGLRQLMMLVKKPQDISEPTIQDTSSHLDVLAMLTMTSWIGSFLSEDGSVTYYGKEKFKRSQSSSASDQGQTPDLEVGSHEVKVKIMSKSPQSQAIRPSKGQVCALVPGQALDCGIGPVESRHRDLDKITYLSAKDVLRWNKASEWLENWERQHPAVNLWERQLERDSLWDSLLEMQKYDPSLPWQSLVGNISDFPGTPQVWLRRETWFFTLVFVLSNRMLLLLLVALPLLYGGIHLATWDFHFASKTEHMLWKIACIDIMGTIPIACLYYEGLVLIGRRFDEPFRIIPSWKPVYKYPLWAFYGPLAIFYALARLYIVVESFISLRHVPIGVYAAVPWVQDIPHV